MPHYYSLPGAYYYLLDDSGHINGRAIFCIGAVINIIYIIHLYITINVIHLRIAIYTAITINFNTISISIPITSR